MESNELDRSDIMLKMAVQKGDFGVTRDDLLRALRGVSYTELEELVLEMVQKGYITMEYIGVCDFVIIATPKGKQQLT